MENEPSSFEFRFLIGERIFIYGFDAIRGCFTSEWLAIAKHGNDEIVVFERDQDGHTSIDDAGLRRHADPVTAQTLCALKTLQLRSDQLFINRAVELPVEARGETLNAIVRWLTTELIVLPVNYRTCQLLDRLYKDTTFRRFCSRFLDGVGTGIAELQIHELERVGHEIECRWLSEYGDAPLNLGWDGCGADTDIRLKPNDPTRVIERRLVARHGRDSRFVLPFSEESDGTQSLLHLLPVLSTQPDQNCVVVIDELDRSLHPLICWEFIRFFSEFCPNARRQLIVTTHEAHLLNQDLLRRDEYWFVEKDDQQQSKLVSLSDFKIRGDLQIQKGYLQGRFGAIPVIGGMRELEQLLECQQEKANAKEVQTA